MKRWMVGRKYGCTYGRRNGAADEEKDGLTDKRGWEDKAAGFMDERVQKGTDRAISVSWEISYLHPCHIGIKWKITDRNYSESGPQHSCQFGLCVTTAVKKFTDNFWLIEILPTVFGEGIKVRAGGRGNTPNSYSGALNPQGGPEGLIRRETWKRNEKKENFLPLNMISRLYLTLGGFLGILR